MQHLGIQVQDRDELTEVYARLQRTQGPLIEEGATTCCYAQSEKSWIDDPQGVPWETFLTMGESTEFGTDQVRSVQEKRQTDASCCGPSCCAPGAAG